MKVEEFLKLNKIEVKGIKYKIIKTKEKQDGVVIYLDNDEKINISVDIYFKYSINSLKGLDDNLYEILKSEERLYLAYKGALKKLASKDHTIKQIKDYLKNNKDLKDTEIKETIDKLLSYGLLDDEKYCANRIKYLNTQLLSNKQINIKLLKEGIPKKLIDRYLNVNEEDEYHKAQRLANKYANSIKNKSMNAKKQLIINKLVNLGFSYDTSKSALNELKLNDNSEIILLEKEYKKALQKYSKKYEGYELSRHIYSYLVNKGFISEDIKNIMEV